MKEISSTDFPQHGEVYYFNGQALKRYMPITDTLSGGLDKVASLRSETTSKFFIVSRDIENNLVGNVT
jgi:hypothetical protein